MRHVSLVALASCLLGPPSLAAGATPSLALRAGWPDPVGLRGGLTFTPRIEIGLDLGLLTTTGSAPGATPTRYWGIMALAYGHVSPLHGRVGGRFYLAPQAGIDVVNSGAPPHGWAGLGVGWRQPLGTPERLFVFGELDGLFGFPGGEVLPYPFVRAGAGLTFGGV